MVVVASLDSITVKVVVVVVLLGKEDNPHPTAPWLVAEENKIMHFEFDE